ncbi:MAG: hypothetical protein JNL60_15915 [Bacteroidia bacterium]|nr:hypothetical protein [Bacteroidia bacterium]
MLCRILLPVILLSSLKLVAQRDTLALLPDKKDSLNFFIDVPLFNTSADMSGSESGQQDMVALLQASKDVFTQFAGGQWSIAQFRLRGYASSEQQISVNGMGIYNLENGSSSWSNWGGLNDVTRFTETRFGLGPGRYVFASAGGYTNIDSRASVFKKNTRFGYSYSNRIFRNRMMFTHSTGATKKGWSLTVSFSSRNGNEVYNPGTYFKANSFYTSVGKTYGTKHEINLSAFVAPTEQGRVNAATKETFDLSGSNYYNSAWGYQNGKIRNANVSKSSRPTIILNDIYSPNKRSRLSVSLMYSFGKTKSSGLNFYDAPNPRPDYYAYLPSYYYMNGDSARGNERSLLWQNDVNTRQINWDELISMNQANLYSDPHVVGQNPNTTETRARYIIENRVNDIKNAAFNTVYTFRKNYFVWSLGASFNLYKVRKYKELEDLLGASFWIDVDQFAEGLGIDETIQQNDIDNPNRKVKKGDKFGYDYTLNIKRSELWSQFEYSLKKTEIYVAATIGNYSVQRNGYIANGKFPDNSKGKSEKLNFMNPGAKAGFTYKINNRNFFRFNILAQSRAPKADHLFISPDTRNETISNPGNESVFSYDLSYIVQQSKFKFRLTGYYTEIKNQVWLRSYWHDAYNTFVNVIMTKVNTTCEGLELGLEKNLNAKHSVQAALALGQYFYSGRPTLEAWQDNNSKVLFNGRQVYLNNYRLGNSAQTLAGIGYRYNGKKYWFTGLNFNYCANIYSDINPERRTGEATDKYLQSESEIAAEIIKQEKLPAFYYLNLNAGKIWRVKKKYPLQLNLSINNLLNNKDILINGTEQLRWDEGNIAKFPNKYNYMTGRTFLINLSLSI